MQGQGEHRLAVYRQPAAVPVKMGPHSLFIDAVVDQNHIDEGIEVVGVGFAGFFIPLPAVQPPDFISLVNLQPLQAAFEHAGRQFYSVAAGDLKPVNHIGRGVRIGSFTISAKPAPAAVGQLHIGKPPDPGPDHFCYRLFIENRIVIISQPLGGPVAVFTEFLGIEIGFLFLDHRQIQSHVYEDSLGDHRRQEAVQGLFGAAIGITRQIRQCIHHCPGKGR